MKKTILVALTWVLFCGVALAKDVPADKQISLKNMMDDLFKNAGAPSGMEYSAMPGFIEMYYAGSVIYVSEDERFVIVNGSVIDVQQKINLTQQSEAKAEIGLRPIRKAAIDSIPDSEAIIFRSPQEKYVITVFTDIDCGYCRKMHQQIELYQADGITVRYLFFPRSGLGSASYFKALSVWCADDRAKALTEAKNGRQLPVKNCDSPIARHMQVVESIGLTGTPAIISASGEMLGGYLSSPELLNALQQQ